MKVTILYRPQSEFARSVEEYAHDIERQHHVTPQLVDIDSRDGRVLADLYDIMSHPAVLAYRDSGELLQHWVGEQLPLMGEVAAYARS